MSATDTSNSVKVITPTDPPVLTDEAARILRQIITHQPTRERKQVAAS